MLSVARIATTSNRGLASPPDTSTQFELFPHTARAKACGRTQPFTGRAVAREPQCGAPLAVPTRITRPPTQMTRPAPDGRRAPGQVPKAITASFMTTVLTATAASQPLRPRPRRPQGTPSDQGAAHTYSLQGFVPLR
jgi:hypothetical protein